jgi:hypothetical protein
VRLVLGWEGVRSFRRRSRPVQDPQLLELLDFICAELSFTNPIEVRQSRELVTAATVGWRRPLILLPREWRGWTEQERRAVLAHEIAHIGRNDFLAWICAQVSVVLHFYHPLVHWLAGRLRLEQELAADAAAAAISGGQHRYLQTLAELALRQADRPVAWPAQTFLPTRRTFLRRIEKLRDKKNVTVNRLSRGTRMATIGLLVLAGIAVAGLRAPNDNLNAQPNESRTAKVALAVKQAPKRTDAQRERVTVHKTTEAQRVQSLNNLKKIGLAFHNYHAVFDHFPPAAVIGSDGKTPYSWRVALLPYLGQPGLYQQYNKNEPWDSPNNKKVLAKMPDVFRDLSMNPKSTNSAYFVLTGDVTVFNDKDGTSMREIKDGTANTIMAVEAKLNIPWTKPVDIPYDADPKKKFPKLGGLYKGGFQVALCDGSVMFVEEKVFLDERLLRAMITIAGNEKGRTGPSPKVKQASKNTNTLRTKSRNHLKFIALAFHNYHNVHNHFPPAAVIGPDGKTPHSWRVALLPYLGEAGLYQQYNKNEPWDSPNNKKVLAKMPGVFRHPSMGRKSTNSAYFVLTGDATLFNNKEGTRIGGVTDGTSNTILAVEAKRNIPWTKPVDFPYDADPKQNFPKLGGFDEGGFHVALCSGSAVFVAEKSLDVTVLRALSTIAGNEMVPKGTFKQASKNTETPRRQSMSNLMRIASAFHRFHGAFKHFPPAAVISPGGKTEYSWHVALLPYLGKGGLYQQYNKNEPWDSPNKKQVLAKMPDVFRHPSMDPKSTNSAYFVVTGDATVFNDKNGTHLRDITDGTENTIMVVEAKRDIPWTKPEDIPYDADPQKNLSKLGGFSKGGFNASLSDGSVQFISEEIDVTELRALFTMAGGEVVGDAAAGPVVVGYAVRVPGEKINQVAQSGSGRLWLFGILTRPTVHQLCNVQRGGENPREPILVPAPDP